MRLIDADALIAQMEADAEQMEDQIAIMFAYAAINDVKHAPTIEERKTGEWMFSPDHAEGICTICQYKIYGKPYQGNYLIVPYNFCPNCGAKMERGNGHESLH